MSYPRLESGPAASPSQEPSQEPSQAEIDEASRRRTHDALHRALSRLAGAAARDWRHCGKTVCVRSRRCRGSACEPDEER